MSRGLKIALPALLAGVSLLAAPLLAPAQAAPAEVAQVQSQPLPPPSGTPQTPPSGGTSQAPATPPATTPAPAKTQPAKTPTPMTKPAQTATPPRNTCPEEKIDINAASAETLRKLPQIGVQRSNAIVKARPYATPEDLLKKKVLKKAVYEKIKTCVNASGVAAVVPAPKPATSTTKPAAKPTAAAKPPAASTPAPPVPMPAPSEPAAKPQQ